MHKPIDDAAQTRPSTIQQMLNGVCWELDELDEIRDEVGNNSMQQDLVLIAGFLRTHPHLDRLIYSAVFG